MSGAVAMAARSAMSAIATPMRIAANSRPRRTRPSAAPYASDATSEMTPERQVQVGERLCAEPTDDERVRADLADPATGLERREGRGDEDHDGPLGRADAGGGRDACERRRTLLRRGCDVPVPVRGAMMPSPDARPVQSRA